MEYTHLGRSGLTVSRLCLGTMNFGEQTDEVESHAIMDSAQKHGINYFDTANSYGGALGPGATEKIIGNWFASGGQRRERTVLATKVYGDTEEWPNNARLSALNIRRALDASLTRLKTDYIDVYQFHHVDRDTPWDEIWQAMETLVTQGKVIYVGSSNFAGWHVAQACEAARTRHFLGLVSEQSLYNLTARTVELELAPACQQYGVGLIPWSPLGMGLLGGILRKEKAGRSADDHIQQLLADKRGQVEAYEAFCDELGHDPAHVGLAWLLAQPAVTAPIVGPRTTEQLIGSLGALEVTLGEAELKRLDEIWPGPGGAAPEAYAW